MARPKGSKNEKHVEHVELPRCPNCDSTDALVLNTNVQEFAGVTGDGKEFNRIVRRRTQCKHCNRVWILRTLELVPEPPTDGPFVPDELDDDGDERAAPAV
jgi:hypothetical protein